MDPICLNKFEVEKCKFTGCTFCPNSPNLVTCGSDHKVHLHQLSSKYRRTDFKGGKYEMTCVTVSPTTKNVSDTIILSANKEGRIRVNETSIQKKPNIFTAHQSCVNSIHFTPDSTRFTTSSNDQTAKVWDFPSLKFLSSLRGHTSWVTSSTFSPDGNVIVTSSEDKSVRLWDVRTRNSQQYFGKMSASVTRAVFHPDGSIIGTALKDGTFSIIDTRNHQVIQKYEAHSAPITSLQFHPTGSFALTTSLDKKICIWDLVEGQLFYTIGSHTSPITDGKWNFDGSRFLTCDSSGVLLQWQTNFDKLIQKIGSTTKSSPDQILADAMDVAPPPPARSSGPPQPTPMTKIEMPSEDLIEAKLDRILNQIQMLTKTTMMLDKRTSMQEEKLLKIQTKSSH
ncbi:POC1 centriolar protein A [Tritrichomonas foetus]|uniref:POC1 centriolar protein A n=1 Tax=Tritrichomonas foetus TaxID=1144522 RepID=A0A1J4KB67_9EUKA|nr:POC1 centriolar protein A [Tritrichomonas foetus]|eukprot:OHT06942.1 POC1 centriolar protein A [Tritrichomonas foetus]